jgi:hypothetical protein
MSEPLPASCPACGDPAQVQGKNDEWWCGCRRCSPAEHVEYGRGTTKASAINDWNYNVADFESAFVDEDSGVIDRKPS